MYYTEVVAHVCSIHSAYFHEGNYGVISLIVQHCHYFIHMYVCTPGPRLMRIHLVRNSTSANFGKTPKIFT